jgi:competence protein ComEA
MENWKDLLTFNRAERRGICVLALIIMLMAGINVMISNEPAARDKVIITRILADASADLDRHQTLHPKHDICQSKSQSRKDSLFFFDPNTLNATGWMLLGLSEKQAAVITGYVKKGGSFKTKEDLKRSFVISEKFFLKVEPWIMITKSNNLPKEKVITGSLRSSTICLNEADTTALKQLKGIGVVLALRIVQYREALGGFFAVEQLYEVYGLKQEVVQQNLHRVSISNRDLRIVRINEAPQKGLETHPYINRKLAWIICTVRAEAQIVSKEDLLARLPAGITVPENLWPYLVY